jgi:hypothetical protein
MFSVNTSQSFVNVEKDATIINICNGISVQNRGIGIAIAKSNNDISMIDHILIEYYKVIQ